jgi:putative two-component system response regulator
VLVADDDERSLDCMVALLAGEGFAIESFLGGRDALVRLGLPGAGAPRLTGDPVGPGDPTARRTTPPAAPGIDFLVLDYNMPDLTGIEVLERLRISFGAPPPPAILVSGESSRELERSWLEVGGFALLPKPVVPDEFRREVRRLIRRHFGIRPSRG